MLSGQAIVGGLVALGIALAYSDADNEVKAAVWLMVCGGAWVWWRQANGISSRITHTHKDPHVKPPVESDPVEEIMLD